MMELRLTRVVGVSDHDNISTKLSHHNSPTYLKIHWPHYRFQFARMCCWPVFRCKIRWSWMYYLSGYTIHVTYTIIINPNLTIHVSREISGYSTHPVQIQGLYVYTIQMHACESVTLQICTCLTTWSSGPGVSSMISTLPTSPHSVRQSLFSTPSRARQIYIRTRPKPTGSWSCDK